MELKRRIDQDLKEAMLGGDKVKTETLRSLKSAILSIEVDKNARETGLPEEEIMQIISKEAKKRQESADLYKQGGDSARAQAELDEKAIIENYLPQQLTEEELTAIVNETIEDLGVNDKKALGQIISAVKQKTGTAAEGSVIAKLVQERLN